MEQMKVIGKVHSDYKALSEYCCSSDNLNV